MPAARRGCVRHAEYACDMRATCGVGASWNFVSRHAELLLGSLLLVSLLLVSEDLQLDARQGREMTNFDARKPTLMPGIDARH